MFHLSHARLGQIHLSHARLGQRATSLPISAKTPSHNTKACYNYNGFVLQYHTCWQMALMLLPELGSLT